MNSFSGAEQMMRSKWLFGRAQKCEGLATVAAITIIFTLTSNAFAGAPSSATISAAPQQQAQAPRSIQV